MAYTINKTDGTVLTTIVDGTLDESTNLSLPGKGYTGYGESQNENFIKLLENFAETTANAPSRPVIGQMFYNKTLDQMQVYDGSNFRAVSGTIVSATEPTFGAQGDLWYNSNSSQIYVYSGTAWSLVGPEATSTTGSISDTVIDNTGTSNNVIKLLVDNSIVAIVSDNEFTPQVTLTGYPTVKKGITLGTNIVSNKFQGTASNSDSLGGIAAANYLRSDTADTMTGTLTIANDNSLVLGVDNDVTFSQSGANFTVTNSSVNGDIIFRVNDAGVTTTALTIDGDTSGVIANNLTVSGNTTLSQLTMSTGTANLNNVTVQGNLTVEGTQTILNTATVEIEDPILLLSNNTSGSPSQNSGIEIKRGSSSNKTLIWNETTDKWTVGSETFVAGTFEGNITGNVTGNVTGNTTGIHTGNVTGDVTGNVTGNLTGDVTADTIITNTISSSDSSLIELQDSLRVTGSLIVNSISSDDSAVVTIQDGLNIGGPIKANDSTEVVVDDSLLVTGTVTADNFVGQVIIGAGSPGAGTTGNVSLDMSTARFFEVYIDADVDVDAINRPNGTIKFISLINTGTSARTITLKIGGVTQQTVIVGDDSTANGKVQLILFSYINEAYYSVQTIQTT